MNGAQNNARLIKLTILLILSTGAACQKESVEPSQRSATALVTVPQVDFGVVSVGQRAVIVIHCVNVCEQAQYLNGVSSGCPCLKIAGAPVIIEPQGAAYLKVTLDTSILNNFKGQILYEVSGRDQAGKNILRFDVCAKVVAAEELASAFHEK